jgi:hypothetical protein
MSGFAWNGSRLSFRWLGKSKESSSQDMAGPPGAKLVQSYIPHCPTFYDLLSTTRSVLSVTV